MLVRSKIMIVPGLFWYLRKTTEFKEVQFSFEAHIHYMKLKYLFYRSED